MRAGLCDGCEHQQLVRSGRGSEFSLCRRHKTDGRYPKYPGIPVLRCAGFEPRRRPEPAAPDEQRRRPEPAAPDERGA